MRSTDRPSILYRARVASRVLVVGIASLPTTVGCAPSTNIGGVYFPAWLVCTVLGVVGAYAVALTLGRSASTRPLADSGLFFVALVTGISLASWLALYSGF